MKQLNRETPFNLPVKVIQFGEGNFLRAFVDWQIDLLNEGSGLNAGVVIVRPISRPDFPLLDEQGGVYTTLIRGLNENGEPVRDFRKIACVKQEIDIQASFKDYLALARLPDIRFIISNTTEAGITTSDADRYDDTPPATFPAKLTLLLHERFVTFNGDRNKGLVLLPCELIDYNGEALKAAISYYVKLWKLEGGFQAWLDDACTFCSTLVDRIVTGYPRDEMAEITKELAYEDKFLVTAEYFYLFVIQGPKWLADELKLEGSGLNIQLVDDITPYKQRKVGVLNGGHTTMVPVALLCGLEAVRPSVEDADVGKFLLEAIDQEIIPALPLPRSELEPFAEDVLRRFRNPYIYHRLDSIALNSWSKYAARVLPQVLRYRELNGSLPRRLVTALAATMFLYRGDIIALQDDKTYLDWFADSWKAYASGTLSLHDMVKQWLGNTALWKQDLTLVPGLVEETAQTLRDIENEGMRQVIRKI
jgi:Mannitol-1-phosphate/altronate dehydrogenases